MNESGINATEETELSKLMKTIRDLYESITCMILDESDDTQAC